jgi:hypothetical protein
MNRIVTGLLMGVGVGVNADYLIGGLWSWSLLWEI